MVFRWIDQCAAEAGNFFLLVRQAEGSFEGWGDAAQCEGAVSVNGSAQEAKATKHNGGCVVGLERCGRLPRNDEFFHG
jgi:hypothetical protein